VRLSVIGGIEAAVREQAFDDLITWIANGTVSAGDGCSTIPPRLSCAGIPCDTQRRGDRPACWCSKRMDQLSPSLIPRDWLLAVTNGAFLPVALAENE